MASSRDPGYWTAGAASGPFWSPSGNINCTMFTSGGQYIARCEVIDHTWVAPPRSMDCHLNWATGSS